MDFKHRAQIIACRNFHFNDKFINKISHEISVAASRFYPTTAGYHLISHDHGASRY